MYGRASAEIFVRGGGGSPEARKGPSSVQKGLPHGEESPPQQAKCGEKALDPPPPHIANIFFIFQGRGGGRALTLDPPAGTNDQICNTTIFD